MVPCGVSFRAGRVRLRAYIPIVLATTFPTVSTAERPLGLMACIVPAGTASKGGAWQFRIAPENPEPEDPVESFAGHELAG